ncbi:MAG: TrbC/VirB2 family protein [Proteobacteria bacterium]|jgi:type IV secretory pathway VirB2 component (pilin)|nr:TrbC/VirB2 family protein [Pseudomonadota bacterium]
MFKKISAFVIYTTSFLALSLVAFANDGTMSGILCQGYGLFNGPLGQGMAIFAIVALGVGLFMGKITWGLVFAVAFGIGAIFGAPKIVSFITGNEMCANVKSGAGDF